MVLVMGRRKIDLSKPFGFCGRHKIALSVLVIFMVMLMSASVCAMTSGPSSLKAMTAGSATAAGGARASAIAGGYANPPRYSPIVYHESYDFSSFSDADWFMALLGTDFLSLMTPAQSAASQAWTINFANTHEGYVRWPKYHKLWSRSEIGQHI